MGVRARASRFVSPHSCTAPAHSCAASAAPQDAQFFAAGNQAVACYDYTYDYVRTA
jgi:hypothetical protein